MYRKLEIHLGFVNGIVPNLNVVHKLSYNMIGRCRADLNYYESRHLVLCHGIFVIQ